MKHSILSLALAAAFLFASAARAQNNNALVIPDKSTVLLMSFDSAPLVDESRLGLEVIAEKTPLTDGKFGRALDCAKLGQTYIPIPEGQQPSKAVTVECWVRYDGGNGENLQRVAGMGSSYGFYFNGARPSLTWYTMTTDESWKSCGTRIEPNVWTHLAGTFDGKVMRLYVDGQLVDEVDNPGVLKTHRRGSLYLGREASADPENLKFAFNGLIDELRISNVAKTEFDPNRTVTKSEPTTSLQPVPENADDILEKRLGALRADVAPVIDGALNDPVWAKAPKGLLRGLRSGRRLDQPTLVQLAWDDKNVYVAFECHEKGQETFVPGESERDSTKLFSADSVEIFFKPEPADPNAPDYQIALNTVGGIFDKAYNSEAGLDWSAEGIEFRSDVHPDSWNMEVAIPYAALGATPPKAGARWAGNFCRTEIPDSTLGSWAPTRTAYRNPEKYGAIDFVAKTDVAEQARTDTHGLAGVLRDAHGAPMVDIRVELNEEVTRTDQFGRFFFSDIPFTSAILKTVNPRYHEVRGLVVMTRPEEILEPIAMKKIDPYVPAFEGPVGAQPIRWLDSSIDEPPDMETKPAQDRFASKLTLLATPGEYESVGVAFFANKAVGEPRARVSALKKGADEIPASAVEVRWTQRCLKRKMYNMVREDAVFTWRFLWSESPDSIEKGHLRHLTVIAKVPESAAPGVYKGELVLSSGPDDPVSVLPVELRVLGFRLEEPKKMVGAYYLETLTRRPRVNKSDELIRMEMKDIREHGGKVLIWVKGIGVVKDKETGEIEYDLSAVRRMVTMQKEADIGPPYIIWTSPNQAAIRAGLPWVKGGGPKFAEKLLSHEGFQKIYKKALNVLDELQTTLGAGEFVYTWMDEVAGRGRAKPWLAVAKVTREATKKRIYITISNRHQDVIDPLLPYIDIRGYHGHTLDWWLGEGHTWEELAADMDKYDAEGWVYYNPRSIDVDSEWTRLCNGYWLWRSPLTAHTPWAHNSAGGNPFDDLDDDRHDFGYVFPHPTKDELVPTLDWEGFREGYDDLRYLTTLERAIERAAAKEPNAKAVADARALRQSYWDEDPRVPEKARLLTAADYRQRREDMASAIEALLKIAGR